MTYPVVKWSRWESWLGNKKQPEKPDDSWSARHGAWHLDIEPMRGRDCNPWREGVEHLGWKWSVRPKDLTTSRSYSGTVPGVDALGTAKHEAFQALKMALASEG